MFDLPAHPDAYDDALFDKLLSDTETILKNI